MRLPRTRKATATIYRTLKDGETSYQYHGARYYDEDLARYMSVDPLAMQFHAWSPYNYMIGNPVMLLIQLVNGYRDCILI